MNAMFPGRQCVKSSELKGKVQNIPKMKGIGRAVEGFSCQKFWNNEENKRRPQARFVGI